MRLLRLALLASLLATTAARADWVDGSPPASGPRSPSTPADRRPPLLRDVGLDPHLGAPLPLDAVFRDETGEARPLGAWLAGRPAVLSLVYFGCPMLCGEVLGSLTASLKPLSLDVGRDFDVLTISFDPRDGPDAAREKKADLLRRYGRRGAERGWHVLTGDADAIARLTAAVGFRYAWDRTGAQFAHVAVVEVVTPDGRLARYFPGIDYPPRDLRLALVEASQGRIGTVVDRLLLFCYHWDASTGRYTPLVARALQLGALLTAAALGTLIVVLRRAEGRT
jgi:protein SCO1/2